MGLAAAVLLTVAGLMAYVRLAEDEVARWHVTVPAAVGGGALVFVPATRPAAVLARLAAVAQGQPRTRLLAGSVAEGRITWVARSLIWGFPDYVTAEVGPEGLRIWSRQRYGRGDHGVNAARLRRWLAAL
jgi:Protein of unknown function (DUF1499)